MLRLSNICVFLIASVFAASINQELEYSFHESMKFSLHKRLINNGSTGAEIGIDVGANAEGTGIAARGVGTDFGKAAEDVGKGFGKAAGGIGGGAGKAASGAGKGFRSAANVMGKNFGIGASGIDGGVSAGTDAGKS